MYLIQEILVSEEVFSKKFVCHIDKCKGACCWDGDYGAPVAEVEKEQIQNAYPAVQAYLSQESIERIEQSGKTTYDNGYGGEVTPLMEDGSWWIMSNQDIKIGDEITWQYTLYEV